MLTPRPLLPSLRTLILKAWGICIFYRRPSCDVYMVRGVELLILISPSLLIYFLSASLKTFITFYTEYYSIVWIETTFYWFHCMDRDHILLVCSSVDMFFRSLAVVNNDLWTSVCQFLCGHMCLFLLGIYQGVGLLGHMVTSSFLCTHLRLRTWSPPYRRSHACLSCPSVSFLRLECPAEPSTCTCVCSQFPTHVQLFVTPWTAEIVRTVHGILQARILEWIVISSSTAFSSYCWRKSLRNFMWLVNSCIANQWHNQNSNPGLEPSSVIFVQAVLYHFLPP